MKTTKLRAAAALAASLGLLSGAAFAQTATSNIVGYVTLGALAASDADLSVPFEQEADNTAVVASTDTNVITVDGTPFVANAYDPVGGFDTYYYLMTSGTREGQWGTIQTNTDSTLTVNFEAGDDLTQIAAGDTLKVIPLWNVATAFPAFPVGTQLLLQNVLPAGVNNAPDVTLTFDGTNWKQGFSVVNGFPILPGEAFKLRNSSGADISQVVAGSVAENPYAMKIPTLAANVQQDSRHAIMSPVGETIGTSGLGFDVGDQVLVGNNAETGTNKAPVDTLTFDGTDWKQGFTIRNDYVLEGGEHFTYRRVGSDPPDVIEVIDDQDYLTP